MSDAPIRAGSALPPPAFDELRHRLCLEHCKWDPQVGDVAALAKFPLIVQEETWRQLSEWAESLASELLLAERELISSPKLLRQLTLPWRLRREMRSANELPRIVRFDFHLTTDGWRISEANSDVPGGLNEGSMMPALMSPHVPGTRPAGDPLQKWADTVANVGRGADGTIALVLAPGFMEDAQVVAGLAKNLAARGIEAMICAPLNLLWDRDGQATLWGQRVSTIVRFVQMEWLPALSSQWKQLCTTRLPVMNPPAAAIVESKRLPLVWGDLATPMPTWRWLLPTVSDPRHVPWQTDDEWIVKPAFGNTGDDVACITWTPPSDWRRISTRIRFNPRAWVAQRRFEVIPIHTPLGMCRPCIGVFTIGGRAEGAYGRLTTGPIIDYRAIDAALLIESPLSATREENRDDE